MVSEQICLEMLGNISCRTVHYTRPKVVVDGPTEVESWHDDKSMHYDHIYYVLGDKYRIPDIDMALRWLRYNMYIEERWSFNSVFCTAYPRLTDWGISVVANGHFHEEVRKSFHQHEEPYAVFLARQFRDEDDYLADYIRDDILKPVGLTLVDGKAEGTEKFRASILDKIKKCRFFLCLLTKREVLQSGEFTSSTWLYAETGIAIAYGKEPLLLVEEGISQHFVGEFQKDYEYESFNQRNFVIKFKKIRQRFCRNLEVNNIPLPNPIP